MASVFKSVIEGSSYTGEGIAALEQTDVFHVTSISKNSRSAYWEAVTASGLPIAWSQHPYTPGLNAVGYTVPKIWQNTKKNCVEALVAVRYVNSQPQFVKRGGVGLRQITTDMDVDGNVIWVHPVKAALGGTTVPAPTGANDPLWQSGELTYTVPDPVIMIERVRATAAYGGVDPEAHAFSFACTINDGTFFGAPAGKVLCENVSYDNAGFGSIANRFTYEFRFRKRGWLEEVYWKNPKTGRPLPGLQKAPGFDQNIPSVPGQGAPYGRKVVTTVNGISNFNALLA